MRLFYRQFNLLLIAVFVMLPCFGQQQVHVHMADRSALWDFPLIIDSIDHMTVTDDEEELLFHLRGDVTVPFTIDAIDRVTVEPVGTDESKDPYQVFQLYITTNDGSDITSRDYYTDCHVSLNAKGSFSNYSALAQIRGRGNSSFLWYDKKPFRLKLNDKHKLLGLDKAKSWVLLANYRDVTDLMNTFVFEAGRWLGLPYTNHTRYVELYVNGDYRGVYQLTEQVQQGKNRVAVSDDRGILISLDVDDGPGEAPDAGDNFWSTVYRMPVCVKYPDDERFTANTVDSVKAVFAELEQAIKAKDYEAVEQLLDIPSFIKYLQLQEFVYNVELSAPRSIYMHKDGDGKWVMGPLWDFDGGYDFDWSNMYAGHTFFANVTETVMGTNPLKRNGNYNYVPQFFTDLFGCKQFVQQYKAQWAAVKDSLVSRNWNECMKYVEHLREGAMDREAERWPLRGKDFETELEKMHSWLKNRLIHMSYLIPAIPEPDDTPIAGDKLCGTIKTNVTMQWDRGYDQSSKVKVSKNRVLSLMGLSEIVEANVTIVPLFTDGSEGPNGTNGVFGGWFDGDGNPGAYANGHVYIEVFDDLWNWNCGLYQWQCWDSEHTVTMQYQYPSNGTVLKVNVEVTFKIENNGW
ncbi:MAG: CotH kinase family protein [Prevotella sp.]|nr:CotH kinase family protein [Prevotella sp.]